jgi:aspartyl-tRNA synthetase
MSDDDIMDLMEGMTVKMFNDLLGVKFDKFRTYDL